MESGLGNNKRIFHARTETGENGCTFNVDGRKRKAAEGKRLLVKKNGKKHSPVKLVGACVRERPAKPAKHDLKGEEERE